jgi:hypothetical protein
MCRLFLNLEASTSWNPQGLSRPVMGLLYLYLPQFFTDPGENIHVTAPRIVSFPKIGAVKAVLYLRL